MGSESDVATDWKTHLVIGKNFSDKNLKYLNLKLFPKFSIVVITLYYQVRYWLEISVFIVNLLEDSCDTWLNSSVS